MKHKQQTNSDIRMTKLILFLLALLIFPIESYAFNFDVWESGESLENSKIIAKKKHIKLKRDRNSHDLRNKVLSNSMHYQSPLFNHNAKITLTFTHSSNLLYRVHISWNELSKTGAKKLKKEILSILQQKYGSFSENSGTSLIVQNGKRCDGKSVGYSKTNKGNRTSLSLSDCFNMLSLTYSNNTLHQIHQQESAEANTISYSDAKKL